MYNFTYAQN